MWKETKVVKNVGYDNFDARYGAYATNESDGSSVINIAGKEFHTRKATRVRVPALQHSPFFFITFAFS